MLRVLEISVRSDIGGGPKHLLELLTEYRKKDITVYAAIPESGEYSSKISQNSKKTLFIPYRKFSLVSFVKLLGFCKRENITVIHSHGRGAGIYSRLLKPFGFKVIHTFHGIHVEETIIGRIKQFADRILQYFTDTFICVSQGESIAAINGKFCSQKNTVVVPNGVKAFSEPIPYLKKEKIIFGSLSRLNFQKGIDILIERVEYITINSPGLCFEVHIAGDGELSDSLAQTVIEKELEHIIKFNGPTSAPLDFLKTLDVYLSTARWEGMPLAVLEAMSLGVPCLCSNVVGNNDIIENNVDGMLFDLEDEKSFFRCFSDIQGLNLREKFGKNGQRKITNSFSVENMSDKTISFYY